MVLMFEIVAIFYLVLTVLNGLAKHGLGNNTCTFLDEKSFHSESVVIFSIMSFLWPRHVLFYFGLNPHKSLFQGFIPVNPLHLSLVCIFSILFSVDFLRF